MPAPVESAPKHVPMPEVSKDGVWDFTKTNEAVEAQAADAEARAAATEGLYESDGTEFDFSEANAQVEAQAAAKEDLYKADGTEFDFSQFHSAEEAPEAARPTPTRRKIASGLLRKLTKR